MIRVVGANIGCFILALILNAVIGGFTLNYCLASIFGKTIAALPAGVIGVFVGEFTLPLSVLFWILRAVGVHTPFVH